MQLTLNVVAERVRQEINTRVLQGYELNGLTTQRDHLAELDRAALMGIHDQLKGLSQRSDWPYDEPSSLDEIRRARPKDVALPPMYLAEAELLNKIHGAWLGRVVGCILGKPLEMGWNQEQIRSYLQGADAYPLHGFVPAQSRSELILRRDCVPSMQGYVQYAQEDDDLNYMCLAIKLLETHGLDFKTLDVGMNWLQSIPFLWTWGPEHVVYLNLATAVGEHAAENIDLEQITSYLNPGEEWIGAQIRTDLYGYVAPGLPELAAELAWRDAYLTHRKSGIYGPMWVSAMNAAAFTSLNMEEIVCAGLAQIPARSRFAEAIHQTLAWCRTEPDWRVTGQHIVAHFDQYEFAGAINNACCVAAALMYGWGDGRDGADVIFERTITIAVQLGYDTDCNGATAGSIVGMMLGAHALPAIWTNPINNTLRTCVVGFGEVEISEMARRTYELSRVVRAVTTQLGEQRSSIAT